MMLWKKAKEKELKMLWEVEKAGKRSFIIGTAHFFPYSFRSSLTKILRGAKTVLFEGPLDHQSMAKVQEAGMHEGDVPHLFESLESKIVTGLTEAIIPACRTRNTFLFFNLRDSKAENPVYELINGMRPWLAFFTLWAKYLERRGWHDSVDLEAHNLACNMDKTVVALETIEEQIEVLKNIPHEKMIHFLERVNQWDTLSDGYAKTYLNGDLENLMTMGLRFPSRHFSVIQERDRIFFKRMTEYLDKGDALVCVGAPHIRGLGKLLEADGYLFHRYPLSSHQRGR